MTQVDPPICREKHGTPSRPIAPTGGGAFPNGGHGRSDATILDGIIGGLERTRRQLRCVTPRSPDPRQVAATVEETEGLLAKLEAIRAEGAGGEPTAN